MFKRAIKKFVNRNKKQIIFALFALIYSFFDNNTEVYKSVAPVVVAEGVKAAKAGVEAAKAAKAAKEAGETAKMIKEGAKAAKELNTAREVAKTARDEIKNEEDTGEKLKKGISTGMALNSALKNDSASKSSFMNVTNKNNMYNTSKNTNPNPEAFSHQSSLGSEIGKPKERRGILSSIGGLFNSVGDGNSKNNVTEESTITEDVDVIKKVNPAVKIGCLVLLPFAFILSIPMILVGGSLPISNVVSKISCTSIDGTECKEEDSTAFLDKLKNLFKYGSFSSNSEIISKKVTETYRKIYNDYDFIIDMPLLISTITVDLDPSSTYEDDSGEIQVTEEMMNRLKYVEDLALLQMVEGSTVYLCNEKEVDGEIKYYETVYYGDTSDIETISGICNAVNVNKYITKVEAKYSAEEYYKNLEENVITDLLYPNYEGNVQTVIEKIKTQYDLYKLIYDNSEDEGNIPSYLMGDEKVHLSSPLKGRVIITSPFGDRDGTFAGFHNGIDVISDDLTIYAAGDGVVTRANSELIGGYIIEITHTDSEGKQYISLYGHLKAGSFLVKVGDTVKVGDPIATMGATGTAASGVHLHFSFWDASTNREYMNPRNLFSEATNY